MEESNDFYWNKNRTNEKKKQRDGGNDIGPVPYLEKFNEYVPRNVYTKKTAPFKMTRNFLTNMIRKVDTLKNTYYPKELLCCL